MKQFGTRQFGQLQFAMRQFRHATVAPPVPQPSRGGAGQAFSRTVPRPKKRRRDTDEEVLLFLIRR